MPPIYPDGLLDLLVARMSSQPGQTGLDDIVTGADIITRRPD